MVLITPEKRTKRMSSKVFQPIKEGKVREVYDNGDSLIIVATDVQKIRDASDRVHRPRIHHRKRLGEL